MLGERDGAELVLHGLFHADGRQDAPVGETPATGIRGLREIWRSIVSRWRRLQERRRLKALERLFLRSERRQTQGLPIRITHRGIWVPTPFPALVSLLGAARANGLFESHRPGRSTLLDAGAGDGRVLAVLAHLQHDLDIVGIESDERLFREATANLESLTNKLLVKRPERLRLARGSYCGVETYRSYGIRFADVSIVFNYPDGNQDELARFVVEKCAPGAKLCLLTHDSELVLRGLQLVSKAPIMADSSSKFWLRVYSR